MSGHRVTEEELRAVEEHKALAKRCGVERVGDLEDGTGMMCVVPFAVLEELERLRSHSPVVPDIHASAAAMRNALMKIMDGCVNPGQVAINALMDNRDAGRALVEELAAAKAECDRLDRAIDRKDEQMAELQEEIERLSRAPANVTIPESDISVQKPDHHVSLDTHSKESK